MLQAYAFAVFADQPSALAALTATNVRFPLDIVEQIFQSHSLQLNYHYLHDFLFIMLPKWFFPCQKSWQQAICLYQVTGNIIDLFLPQGMVFDLEKNCSLHVDLAKSNSRSKRLRSGSLQFQDSFPALLWVLHWCWHTFDVIRWCFTLFSWEKN